MPYFLKINACDYCSFCYSYWCGVYLGEVAILFEGGICFALVIALVQPLAQIAYGTRCSPPYSYNQGSLYEVKDCQTSKIRLLQNRRRMKTKWKRVKLVWMTSRVDLSTCTCTTKMSNYTCTAVCSHHTHMRSHYTACS